MSNYTVVTNWVGLDSLLDTDPNKVISGAVFETEFTTLQTALNSKQDELTIKDEDDLASDSATAVASQQSIKAYVDTEISTIPRVSPRVCLWEGVNGTPANGLFDAPTADRQHYTIVPNTHVSLNEGTLLKVSLEWECVNDEDTVDVGDVFPFDNTMHDSEESSYPIWYNHAGDFSESEMKIEFNVGDYGDNNNVFHLWTRPGGSSSNHWYQKANFALYARLYYQL